MYWLLLTSCLVTISDQVGKAVVLRRFREGQVTASRAHICIRPTTNSNVGLIRNPYLLLGLWCIAVTGLLLSIQFEMFLDRRVAPIGLGVALGGASSNLWDRLKGDGVIDYIDIGFWRVFNPADIAIIAGVTIQLLYILR
jgi:signal peptidase II